MADCDFSGMVAEQAYADFTIRAFYDDEAKSLELKRSDISENYPIVSLALPQVGGLTRGSVCFGERRHEVGPGKDSEWIRGDFELTLESSDIKLEAQRAMAEYMETRELYVKS